MTDEHKFDDIRPYRDDEIQKINYPPTGRKPVKFIDQRK